LDSTGIGREVSLQLYLRERELEAVVPPEEANSNKPTPVRRFMIRYLACNSKNLKL